MHFWAIAIEPLLGFQGCSTYNVMFVDLDKIPEGVLGISADTYAEFWVEPTHHYVYGYIYQNFMLNPFMYQNFLLKTHQVYKYSFNFNCQPHLCTKNSCLKPFETHLCTKISRFFFKMTHPCVYISFQNPSM